MIPTNEIEDAISNITRDIYSPETEEYDLVYSSNGFSQRVDFCGINLWDSEEDSRFKEEPIEECLRRKLRLEIQKISNIKV